MSADLRRQMRTLEAALRHFHTPPDSGDVSGAPGASGLLGGDAVATLPAPKGGHPAAILRRRLLHRCWVRHPPSQLPDLGGGLPPRLGRPAAFSNHAKDEKLKQNKHQVPGTATSSPRSTSWCASRIRRHPAVRPSSSTRGRRQSKMCPWHPLLLRPTCPEVSRLKKRPRLPQKAPKEVLNGGLRLRLCN